MDLAPFHPHLDWFPLFEIKTVVRVTLIYQRPLIKVDKPVIITRLAWHLISLRLRVIHPQAHFHNINPSGLPFWAEAAVWWNSKERGLGSGLSWLPLKSMGPTLTGESVYATYFRMMMKSIKIQILFLWWWLERIRSVLVVSEDLFQCCCFFREGLFLYSLIYFLLSRLWLVSLMISLFYLMSFISSLLDFLSSVNLKKQSQPDVFVCTYNVDRLQSVSVSVLCIKSVRNFKMDQWSSCSVLYKWLYMKDIYHLFRVSKFGRIQSFHAWSLHSNPPQPQPRRTAGCVGPGPWYAPIKRSFT